jgi:hypothetical protein
MSLMVLIMAGNFLVLVMAEGIADRSKQREICSLRFSFLFMNVTVCSLEPVDCDQLRAKLIGGSVAYILFAGCILVGVKNYSSSPSNVFFFFQRARSCTSHVDITKF